MTIKKKKTATQYFGKSVFIKDNNEDKTNKYRDKKNLYDIRFDCSHR